MNDDFTLSQDARTLTSAVPIQSVGKTVGSRLCVAAAGVLTIRTNAKEFELKVVPLKQQLQFTSPVRSALVVMRVGRRAHSRLWHATGRCRDCGRTSGTHALGAGRTRCDDDEWFLVGHEWFLDSGLLFFHLSALLVSPTGQNDSHDIEGLFTRDLMRICNGVPAF